MAVLKVKLLVDDEEVVFSESNDAPITALLPTISDITKILMRSVTEATEVTIHEE